MTTQQLSKGLRWMRDYGIILLTAAILVLTVAYFRHDYLVGHQILPNVINSTEEVFINSAKIDRNSLLIDSLKWKIYKLESIIQTPYDERFPEEHAKLHQTDYIVDSLEYRIKYLEKEISYLDSIVRVPYNNRNFEEPKEK